MARTAAALRLLFREHWSDHSATSHQNLDDLLVGSLSSHVHPGFPEYCGDSTSRGRG
ncbi:hypothetical protein LHJ74_02255 [Streptomyces sp. N2-109]|uniref:Uncharacterized protein n=1 Tax=Streptomyces gossypii TaxID=2883101 RepID=A0ABT2JLL9_9ACTN|nr:hypothetical protein [Streptomyces gossypii]MCT2588771.1 hypothetical protein [Streptomyces gossypii]